MRPSTVLVLGATSLSVACTDPVQPPPRHDVSPTTSLASGSAVEMADVACDTDLIGENVCGITVTYADGSTRLLALGHVWDRVTWSPDATRIAFGGDAGEVMVVTVADGRRVRLTNHPATDDAPAWSPDGARIVFQSNRDGALELYVMSADGSNVVRLTNGAAVQQYVGRPRWSPDGARIAFTCGERTICTIRADGTGLARITGDGVSADLPAWSPDGARIAFAGYDGIYVMNADGSGVTRLTNEVVHATEPDWSPDGTRILFAGEPKFCGSFVCTSTVYVMNADGSALRSVAYGGTPVWAPAPPPLAPEGLPVAKIYWPLNCSLLTCTFYSGLSFDDGFSFNYAGIVSWSWDFGDGQTSTASTPTHTYAAAGTYDVTLTVTDGSGLSDATTVSVTPDAPPNAAFTVSCVQFECGFVSNSRDDYGLVSWQWDFGDGQGSTSPNPSHTYGAVGTYVVTHTVTDGSGSTDSETKSIVVITPIALGAIRSRDHGIAAVDLSWSGASAANVDVFRNGVHLVTTVNDGAHRDTLGRGAKGKYTYRVCNAGTTTCSLPVTVTF